MHTILNLTYHSNKKEINIVVGVRYNSIGHILKTVNNDISDMLIVQENRGCSFPWRPEVSYGGVMLLREPKTNKVQLNALLKYCYVS
jgi:hypothetical protein